MIYLLTLILIPWIAFEIYTYRRINSNMQALMDRKTDQINVIERLLKEMISHEEMKAYIQEIDERLRLLRELESTSRDDRWKTWRAAFGGKEE